MKLKVFGTRGSAPMSDPSCCIYGGNTSSFLYTCSEVIIFDAGTGFNQLCKELKYRIETDGNRVNKPVYILLSHYHMDHICGICTGSLFQMPGMEIHIYGPQIECLGCGEILKQFMSKPFWPVSLDDCPADIHYHDVMPADKIQISDKVVISVIESNHPDQCVLYKLEERQGNFSWKSLGYMLDFEYDESERKKYEAFFHGCDLIVFDGSFLPGKEIKGWGHSSWKAAVDFLKSSKAKEILVSHYGCELSDSVLAEEESLASKEDSHCRFAKEGMEIEI